MIHPERSPRCCPDERTKPTIHDQPTDILIKGIQHLTRRSGKMAKLKGVPVVPGPISGGVVMASVILGVKLGTLTIGKKG